MERLTDEGRAGHLGLPRIAAELYQSARRLRVFVARPVTFSLGGVAALLGLGSAVFSAQVRQGTSLL